MVNSAGYLKPRNIRTPLVQDGVKFEDSAKSNEGREKEFISLPACLSDASRSEFPSSST